METPNLKQSLYKIMTEKLSASIIQYPVVGDEAKIEDKSIEEAADEIIKQFFASESSPVSTETPKHTSGKFEIIRPEKAPDFILITHEGKCIYIGSEQKRNLPLAEFIVRACNNHQSLLDAIKECRSWYEDNFNRLAPDTPICFSKALTAIQKAQQ